MHIQKPCHYQELQREINKRPWDPIPGTILLRECLQEFFLPLNNTSLELPACLRSNSTVSWCLQELHRRRPSPLSLTRCFYPVFNLYKEPSFTHVYIVLYSATMLMIGPRTFLEDEEKRKKMKILRKLSIQKPLRITKGNNSNSIGP